MANDDVIGTETKYNRPTLNNYEEIVLQARVISHISSICTMKHDHIFDVTRRLRDSSDMQMSAIYGRVKGNY
jgi:hypothetical protein